MPYSLFSATNGDLLRLAKRLFEHHLKRNVISGPELEDEKILFEGRRIFLENHRRDRDHAGDVELCGKRQRRVRLQASQMNHVVSNLIPFSSNISSGLAAFSRFGRGMYSGRGGGIIREYGRLISLLLIECFYLRLEGTVDIWGGD